jgi:hypothetical protein
MVFYHYTATSNGEEPIKIQEFWQQLIDKVD